MGATHFTEDNFETEVLKSKTPVLVDFWAEWCVPCRAVAPIIEELSGELAGKMKIGKVNVDQEQNLSARYNIMSIPTMLVFKNGEPVEQIVGAMGKDQLLQRIKPQLA